MRKIHVTKDGASMPIPSMGDDHLTNMCNLFAKKMTELKSIATGATDKFTSRLYGIRTVSPEDAADAINMILEQAAPYFMEAYLRGLEGPRNMLRDVYGRSIRLEGFDNTILLNPGDSQFDDADLDEFQL